MSAQKNAHIPINLFSHYNINYIPLGGVNTSFVDEEVKKIQPDIVIYDRFLGEEQYSHRVQRYAPNVISIIDTQDVHFLRYAREEMLSQGKSVQEISNINFFNSKQFSSETVDRILREIASIMRTDATILSSFVEQDILKNQFLIPNHKLTVAPFYYKSENTTFKPFHRRKDFIFIGNFRHRPNKDAILWLKEKIWKKLAPRLPDVHLKIYGDGALMEDYALENKQERFLIKGQLKPEYLYSTLSKHRVNLAPLRYGAGIKGKITDGWHVGTPVVSTSIGMEGMNQGQRWGGLVADTDDSFVEAALKLYTDEEMWMKSQLDGKYLMENQFDEDKNGADFKNWIGNLASKRAHDWVKDVMWMSERRYTEEFGSKITLKETLKKEMCSRK